ncbi:anthranilate synthase component II [Aureitalea marina]|uniref:Aminodeoxychorismate/anthranilate synthase component II n=1 Tax=Aureitalea marina TaxID=930804 RepID=A0A2S7KQH2_9FLAO|nr:aminodeoxychorismate/anthranilate synthase component II [Aureitalea marina]PQB04865.1 aminodeoxychorismate/anthranilate synthase component II [Aureitalea marina]
MRILVIDNYDSFVYNLVHYLEELNVEVVIRRNDEVQLDEVVQFDKILLSPGPGIPDESGMLKKVIEHYARKKPMLGVCLGHQAIGEVFGGELENLDTVFHGVATLVTPTVSDEPLFTGLEAQFEVGRYHSWVVRPENLPDELEITALDGNGQIMAMRHRTLPLTGVQFHPESVLTPDGKKMIENWVKS